jgi:hypothetical protein
MNIQLRRATGAVGLLLLIGLLALLPTHAGATSAQAAATSTCVAKIERKGQLETLFTFTYKYKFRRIGSTSRYQRTVVRIKVAVRVSCAKQCVLMKSKRGKRFPVYSIQRVNTKDRRGNTIVTVKKRRRVYKYTACKIVDGVLGVPVGVNILPGSYATLDFGAFQRQANLSGSLSGFVPGSINLKADNQVNLTKGRIDLASTPVFIDDACNGIVSAAIRTGTPSFIGLDPTKQSISTLFASGVVTSTAYTRIRVPLELRNDDGGCDKPYITTGYTEFVQTFFLKGRIQPDTGLSKLTLKSAPQPLDVEACLSPGSPTQPCSGFVIPLPILVSANLVVQIDLSGKTKKS